MWLHSAFTLIQRFPPPLRSLHPCLILPSKRLRFFSSSFFLPIIRQRNVNRRHHFSCRPLRPSFYPLFFLPFSMLHLFQIRSLSGRHTNVAAKLAHQHTHTYWLRFFTIIDDRICPSIIVPDEKNSMLVCSEHCIYVGSIRHTRNFAY